MSESPAKFKWRHPSEVMQLHNLKKKKKALQARIQSNGSLITSSPKHNAFDNILSTSKRKNPFITSGDSKRNKTEIINTEESTDITLFKLLHLSSSTTEVKENITTFDQILTRIDLERIQPQEIKVTGEKWIPIDWTLKTKVRFLAQKPFAWNQKLKISEEASGITGFTRCLDTSTTTSSLDISPNSKFHQCCLYWQQPCLPWMSLFPRHVGKTGNSIATTSAVKESLQTAWTDSLKSLFHLIRTRQCPYFYACANSFTVLFRAAGICGFNEMHALITPTTRGFRQLLQNEEIEFTMPLKKKRDSDAGYETLYSNSASKEVEEEAHDEDWLESMGINHEDIKQINYTQARIVQRMECELDNSEQSLVLVEGLEVQALYSFLINCKSAIALTGAYAGIPPTLLAPVAFGGASLMGLKVRESKVHIDNEDLYSIDLSGPILPHTIHNLAMIHPRENSMTATFCNFEITEPFSKVFCPEEKEESSIFRQENLSDCGLVDSVLKHFCSDSSKHVSNIECLKYTADTQTYAWS